MAASTPLSPEDLLPAKGGAGKTEELEEDTEEEEDEVSGSLPRNSVQGLGRMPSRARLDLSWGRDRACRDGRGPTRLAGTCLSGRRALPVLWKRVSSEGCLNSRGPSD